MPLNGGFNPNPERYGGGKPVIQFVLESLVAQLGSGYDTSPSSNVYPQLVAFARAIAGAWSDNARMANQWDADRMTDFLARWEAILGIIPKPTDTDVARRARVEIRRARVGQPANFQGINDVLARILTTLLVGITTTTSSAANVWTPAGWPMGLHDPNGVINWYSTVAYLAIKVTKPSAMSDGEFYELVGSISPELDSMLPAWVTFDWYRDDISNRPGFWLDETNLDNEAFD